MGQRRSWISPRLPRAHPWLPRARRPPHRRARRARRLLADAAARLSRYFTEALPLHSQDEDASITPRLLGAAASAELADALAAGASEHLALDAGLAALTPIWAAIARDPSTLDAARRDLDDGIAPVAALFPIHLAREEQIVFPP